MIADKKHNVYRPSCVACHGQIHKSAKYSILFEHLVFCSQCSQIAAGELLMDSLELAQYDELQKTKLNIVLEGALGIASGLRKAGVFDET